MRDNYLLFIANNLKFLNIFQSYLKNSIFAHNLSRASKKPIQIE